MNHVYVAPGGKLYSDDTLSDEGEVMSQFLLSLASNEERFGDVVELWHKYCALANEQTAKLENDGIVTEDKENIIIAFALRMMFYAVRRARTISEQQDDIMKGGVFDG